MSEAVSYSARVGDSRMVGMDTKADMTPATAAGDAAPPTPQAPAKVGWFTWLQATAHIAEIVGVVVVIVSLFYLSVQIQQNTTQLRRADLNATHDHWSAIRLFIAGDPEHAAFLSSSLNSADLDPPDRLRFNALMAEHARATFQIWDRNSNNSGFDPNDFAQYGAPPLVRLLCTVGGSVWWKQFQSEFPPPFVSEVDKALAVMIAGPGSGDPAHPCVGASDLAADSVPTASPVNAPAP